MAGHTKTPGEAHGKAAKADQKPETLGELLPKVLDELGLDQASTNVQLIRRWDEALGPELAPHCRPEGLRRGVVHATVPDSAWMQRLQFEKRAILGRLREALDDDSLADLRLRLSGVSPISRNPGSRGPRGSSG